MQSIPSAEPQCSKRSLSRERWLYAAVVLLLVLFAAAQLYDRRTGAPPPGPMYCRAAKWSAILLLALPVLPSLARRLLTGRAAQRQGALPKPGGWLRPLLFALPLALSVIPLLQMGAYRDRPVWWKAAAVLLLAAAFFLLFTGWQLRLQAPEGLWKAARDGAGENGAALSASGRLRGFWPAFFTTLAGLGLNWCFIFPSGANMDTANQWDQIHGLLRYSDIHAPTHTLYLKALLSVWDSYGMVILFQITALAVLFGCFSRFLAGKGVPPALTCLLIAAHLLCMTVSQTYLFPFKDVPYTLCAGIVTLLLCCALDVPLPRRRTGRKTGRGQPEALRQAEAASSRVRDAGEGIQVIRAEADRDAAADFAQSAGCSGTGRRAASPVEAASPGEASLGETSSEEGWDGERRSNRQGGFCPRPVLSLPKAVLLGVCLALITLFRYNGIVVTLGCGLWFVWRFVRARQLRQLLAMAAAALVCAAGVELYVRQALRPDSLENGFSIQVFGSGVAAVVACGGEITPAQWERIQAVLPVRWMEEKYGSWTHAGLIWDWDNDPRLQDPNLRVFNNGFVLSMGMHKEEVVRLYLSLLPRNLGLLFRDVLYNTSSVYGIYTENFPSCNVFLTGLLAFAAAVRWRRSQWRERWAAALPILCNMLSIAISTITNEFRYLLPTAALFPFLLLYVLSVRQPEGVRTPAVQ